MLTEAGLGFGGVEGLCASMVLKGEQSLQQPRALGTQSSPQSPGTHKWHQGPGDNRP